MEACRQHQRLERNSRSDKLGRGGEGEGLLRRAPVDIVGQNDEKFYRFDGWHKGSRQNVTISRFDSRDKFPSHGCSISVGP